MAHLDPAKYEVTPVGITRDGVWTVGETDPEKLRAHGRDLPEVELRQEISLSTNPLRRGEFHTVDTGAVHATVDVVVPVMHGPFGEDGTIQGLFEMAGVPYVGPGVLASAAGMDKEFTKKLMVAEGLPVTPEVILRDRDELTEAEQQELGLPVFVKPARGGSSIGISKVDAWVDLPAATAHARESDPKVIVESMITGMEVEVGVLQYPDGSLLASEPAQLNGTEESDEGFYGFDTKYIDNVVTATIPAQLGPKVIEELKEMAVKTFEALNCKGLARVDFFVTEDGPVLNEINTMPGFTPISMYPQVFAATGVAYEELLDIMIATALS